MQTWAAWLYLAGATATAVGLAWAWVELRLLWRRQWPDKDLFPTIATARRRLRALLRRPVPPVSGEFDPNLSVPPRRIGPPLTNWSQLSPKNADVQLQLVRWEMRNQGEYADKELARVEKGLAEHQAETERRNRDNTRAALRWPSVLAILGAAAQAVAALLIVIDLSS